MRLLLVGWQHTRRARAQPRCWRSRRDHRRQWRRCARATNGRHGFRLGLALLHLALGLLP